MIEQWQLDLLNTYGWYYTAHFHSPDMPNNVDIHTHGVFEKYDHFDLQVCLPVTMQELPTISGLFDLVIDEISRGNHFEAGRSYVGLLPEPYSLTFAAATVAGKRYLRILYPDTDGQISEFPYNTQLQQLTDHHPLLPVFYESTDIIDIGDVAQFILSLNTAHGLIYHPAIDLNTYCLPGETEPAFGTGAIRRLGKVLNRCLEVCGKTYSLEKIAKYMEVVRKGMEPQSWLSEDQGLIY